MCRKEMTECVPEPSRYMQARNKTYSYREIESDSEAIRQHVLEPLATCFLCSSILPSLQGWKEMTEGAALVLSLFPRLPWKS